MIYDNLKKNLNNKIDKQNKLHYHFVKGPFVEITGPKTAKYTVEFIDNSNGELKYKTTIGNNCWCRCSIEYFVEWKIKIFENGKLWNEFTYDASNKRVYIALDSRALGDTLSWFPYLEEFRKKHNCKLVASTFMNDFFASEYPNIEFIKPGDTADNLYAMYCIGLFYNEDDSINLFKNPIDPKTVTGYKQVKIFQLNWFLDCKDLSPHLLHLPKFKSFIFPISFSNLHFPAIFHFFMVGCYLLSLGYVGKDVVKCFQDL